MIQSIELSTKCFYCKKVLQHENYAHSSCLKEVYGFKLNNISPIYDAKRYIIHHGNTDYPNRLWYSFEGLKVQFYAYQTLIGIYFDHKLFIIENVFSMTSGDLMQQVARIMGIVRDKEVYSSWMPHYYEKRYLNVFQLPIHAFREKIRQLGISESINEVQHKFWYEMIDYNLYIRDGSRDVSYYTRMSAALWNKEVEETSFRKHIHIVKDFFMNQLRDYKDYVVYLDYNKTRIHIKLWKNDKYDKIYEITSIKSFRAIESEIMELLT